jgi:hypothetical protein
MKWYEKLSVAAAVCVPAFGVFFEKVLYRKLPVSPGEPYGVGDVLAGLLFFAVVGTSSAALFAGSVRLIMPKFRNFATASLLIGLALVSFFSYAWYIGYLKFLLKQLMR